MQSAVIPSEAVVYPLQQDNSGVARHDSGFWSVRESEVEGVEIAAAIALAVHRGVILPAPRRMLPVRG